MAPQTPLPPRRARLALVPAVLLLAGGLAACNEARSNPEAGKAHREPPVLVQPVRFEAVRPDRALVGVVRPRIESELGFRVSGKVARRAVEVGQAVRAGDVLAELDATDLTLQREQAEAELRAATAAWTQASADEQRLVELRGRGWTPDATLERQRAAAAEALARRERAERAVVLARNALAYATLAADADGVVTATQVEPGQVVAAGQTAVRIARGGEKEAAVAVPESLVAGVRDGVATVTLWSRPDRVHAATLRELAPAADPVTRTYAARFAIPDADEAVKLGMTATVTLSAPARDRVARLPLSALFNQGQGPSLWVADPSGALALRPVAVAGYTDREVLVSGGVADGDLVVTLGVQKLDAGRRVRVVQALGL